MQSGENSAMDAEPMGIKILACLAKSPRIGSILSESAQVAQLLRAQLKFIHVGALDPGELDDLRDAIRGVGIEPTREVLIVREGRPAETIREVALQERMDVIIAGALEREGLLDSLMMGSIARRIARTAPCSVLLLARGHSPAGERFAEVVVATKCDEASRVMLEVVAREARRVGTSKLHVVREYDDHELRMLRHASASLPESMASRRRMELDQQAILADYLAQAELHGLTPHAACLSGGEGVAAMEYAEECNADLLVYPAPMRKLSFWDRFFNDPGCVVLQQIQCALLFYRPSPHRAGMRRDP